MTKFDDPSEKKEAQSSVKKSAEFTTPRRSFLMGSAAAAAGAAAFAVSGTTPAFAGGQPAPQPGPQPDFRSPSSLGAAARHRGSSASANRKATQIGIGYETWFDAVGWPRPEAEPVLGHYSSLDEGVIRQHAAWITYAGIDHIIADWSNNLGGNWTSGTAAKIIAGTDKVFEVYSKMPANARPQIAILLGVDNGQAGTANFNAQIDQIKTKYLANKAYNSLLVQHDGKPLLTIYTGARTTVPPTWSDPAFTVRWMGAFREIVLNPGGQWSWVDRVAYANGAETAISAFDSAAFSGWSADAPWSVQKVTTQPAFNVSLDEVIATSQPVGNADQKTGNLTSAPFTITQRVISFNAIGFDMSAGSDLPNLDGRNVYLLKDAVTGAILRSAVPPGDSTRLYVRQWNVSDLVGRSVVFQAVNNSTLGGLGWFGFTALIQQRPEQMTAVVANPGNEGPGSFANWDAHSRNSGANLVEMIANAYRYEPEFLTIQQWNEFGRPDQFSVAGSNDIEPTKITTLAGADSDGWGFYYLKLVRDLVDQYRSGAAFPAVTLDSRYP
ncbi:hypothetical protein B7R22_06895 [Subtercola boreus]|uniref:Uncharacterized protein n=1 Tax=Subtercola boreus TaxID=120213 RepID=A0A3E0W154_9MICO|nr:hypothetical protein [Subtercola boreus]RFA15545.1 hypothetical protein B7R22_06895 [Subtercola boreus]